MFSYARQGKQSLHPCSRNLVRSACCHGCCFLFWFCHQFLANQVSRLFLFETNQCSRLKTHPGILMLLSFISNFDFVVLTSIFLVDVMQLDLTIIIFYFSNQIQRVFQQFDCFGSLLILDCWTVNSSRSLTTGIYLKKHNYH